ncbi:glycosyltransferase [Candidatus Bathyarchaeota archaeon]|nr:glycosyltransferase [Candidatus Bathyarchaeota archaeon]
MRVITGIPWNLDSEISGFSKRIRGCFSSVADLGVNVDTYCLGPEEKKGNLNLIRLHVNRTPLDDEYSPLLNSVAFSQEFSKKIQNADYDVLHCFNTTSLFLGKKERIFETNNPTYAFALEQIRDQFPTQSKFDRLLNYYRTVSEIDKLEYENADIIISPSELVKESINRYYNVNEEDIQVIPHGVFEEECNFPQDKSYDNQLRIILFPGNIHVMKGFRYLLEAMTPVRKEYPNSMLLVCGRIRSYESELFIDLLREKRKESGLVLAGFLPRERLYRYYHEADVCCLPLIFGTMSMAVLESIAHGLPVISTEHCGLPELNQVGLKVPPKDSEAISEAILTLLSDSKKIRRKSENSKTVIKSYLWSKIAEQYTDLYRSFS